MERAVYFISDLHLGRHSKELEARKRAYLTALFKQVRTQQADLIINGDLFDFWFDYHTVIPKKCYWVCYELSKLAEAGITIHMVSGNHDFWMFTFFQEEMGVIMHHEPFELTLHGKRFFIAHGDGMAAKDHMYRMLRRVIRHPVSTFLYRWVHPDFGIWFADVFSKRGGKKHEKKNQKIKPADYHPVAQNYLQAGYDVVVFGHTHAPEIIEFPEGLYLNIGNWIEDFSYGALQDCHLELRFWEQSVA